MGVSAARWTLALYSGHASVSSDVSGPERHRSGPPAGPPGPPGDHRPSTGGPTLTGPRAGTERYRTGYRAAPVTGPRGVVIGSECVECGV